uniref:ARAD1D35508p n=1 Tax=Blastobotrys adeninivorans TaxID=409370 RepID=A0A060TBI8_BLAAD
MTDQITASQKMLAACSGSLLTSVVVNPFDVIRVRLQQQSAFPINTATSIAQKLHPVTQIPSGLGVTACCKDVFWYPSSLDYCVASEFDCCAVDEAKQRRFLSTWDGIKKIVQYEGAPTLWRGLSFTLLMSIPSNVVYFTGYEYMRDNSPIQSEILNPLLCGGLARTLSSTFVSPLELIKTRLQSVSEIISNSSASSSSSQQQPASVPGSSRRTPTIGAPAQVEAATAAHHESPTKVVFRGIRQMVASQGVLSLWKGLVLTLWRDVPFSAVYWANVEYIRRELNKLAYFQQNDATFFESFISGSVAGAIAAVVTTPFDVGKTRQQVGHHEAKSSRLGMLPFMGNIVKNEGISALFVGVTPRVLKVAPACAIMISSYEMGKKVFRQQNCQCDEEEVLLPS